METLEAGHFVVGRVRLLQQVLSSCVLQITYLSICTLLHRWLILSVMNDARASPSTWSSVPEFDALVALGPKVIPLVLGKMVADSTDAAPAYLCTSRAHGALLHPARPSFFSPALLRA